MIIHRLTYEIYDSDHPFEQHPQAYVQKAVSEEEMVSLKKSQKALFLACVQSELLNKMDGLMKDLSKQMTMTEEEIENNNLNDIHNLLIGMDL